MSGHRPPGGSRYVWTRRVATPAEVAARAVRVAIDRYVISGDAERLDRDLDLAISDPRAFLTPPPPPPPPRPRDR